MYSPSSSSYCPSSQDDTPSLANTSNPSPSPSSPETPDPPRKKRDHGIPASPQPVPQAHTVSPAPPPPPQSSRRTRAGPALQTSIQNLPTTLEPSYSSAANPTFSLRPANALISAPIWSSAASSSEAYTPATGFLLSMFRLPINLLSYRYRHTA